MSSNHFSGTKTPAAPAAIAALEQAYHFVLPTDYKAHVLAQNGGWPERRTFMQVSDNEQIPRKISNFKPILGSEAIANSLEKSLQVLRNELHNDLVPFGSEAGGDLFALSVGPEDYGSVYYIAHEVYKPPKRKLMNVPRQYGPGVYFLAPSFTDFLNDLVHVAVPDEDDE